MSDVWLGLRGLIAITTLVITASCFTGVNAPATTLPENSTGPKQSVSSVDETSAEEKSELHARPGFSATLASILVVSFSETQQASALATQTAWEALPLEVGTPTAPAPSGVGVDLANPNSWRRLQDATGISYEHLVSHQVDQFAPFTTITSEVNGAWVGQAISGTVPPSPDSSIAVQAYRSPDSVVTRESFPEQISLDWGQAHWPMRINAKQTTDAWVYVFGERNTSPAPGNTQFWDLWPVLVQVELYNADCQLGIGFSTSFGIPGPIEDALARPLDEVIAEHFPVLDHMYRSVQFPPECSAPAPPSPLETPTPP